jgi:hypothetical protein
MSDHGVFVECNIAVGSPTPTPLHTPGSPSLRCLLLYLLDLFKVLFHSQLSSVRAALPHLLVLVFTDLVQKSSLFLPLAVDRP